MEFVAIDVETANADMSSICQIGMAHFGEKGMLDEWVSYIDPEDFFDDINTSIHGIDETVVKGAPKFKQLSDELYGYLDDRIVVCHTHFDRVAIKQTSQKYVMRDPDCTWIDSAIVARRTWQEFSQRGYGLKNVCEKLGYTFKHHDALEDAKAAGTIMLAALEYSGLSAEEWFEKFRQPLGSASIKKEGDSDGSLYGEVLVFTGSLNIPRREAADIAAKLGCTVKPGVTKKTTMLVVGDQDVTRLAGHTKSSKHRKAEKLILGGQEIKILRQSDFVQLASFHS